MFTLRVSRKDLEHKQNGFGINIFRSPPSQNGKEAEQCPDGSVALWRQRQVDLFDFEDSLVTE